MPMQQSEKNQDKNQDKKKTFHKQIGSTSSCNSENGLDMNNLGTSSPLIVMDLSVNTILQIAGPLKHIV